jgi:hypothetical protein
MRKTESNIEHLTRTNMVLHDHLVKEFMRTTKSRIFVTSREGNATDITTDTLCKLASSIGYMQQTQAALQKNIYTEKDIKAINTRLDRIPPELLQSITDVTILEEPIGT